MGAVTVKPYGELSILKNPLEITNLNLEDTLPNIRKELRFNNVDINDSISFVSRNKSEISYEMEKERVLKDIMDEDNSFYLMQSERLNWRYFNESLKLDYGRIQKSVRKIVQANKRAYTMENCELTKNGINGFKKETFESASSEDWMKKTNLFFTSDINNDNIIKFAGTVGLSGEISQDQRINYETNTTYECTEVCKVILKFSDGNLKPTPEFIKVVNEAIDSGNLNKLKEIIEDYGQFIPTEALLGGRIYSEYVKRSRNNYNDNSIKSSISASGAGVNIQTGFNSNRSENNSKSYSVDQMRLFGGKLGNSEEEWIKSLDEDFKLWYCIEIRNHKSIFEFLSEDLRKKIIKIIGKRILYSNTIDYKYDLRFGNPAFIALSKDLEKSEVLKIIQNKDSDYSIFAVILDVERPRNSSRPRLLPSSRSDIKGSLVCQVLFEPDKTPKLIIHSVQRNAADKVIYNLKIGLMIIGYDLNFKMIYSDLGDPLHVEKKDFAATSSMFSDKTFDFDLDYNLPIIPCLGIPVLNKLDKSARHIIMGHHFYDTKEENKAGVFTFSYDLKQNRYVNLPSFTFYMLTSDQSRNFRSLSFRKEKFSNQYYVESNSSLKPKYFSLYISERNYKPFFLHVKKERINVIHSIVCSCGNTCRICQNKKSISKNDGICILFDPDTSEAL